MDLIKAYDFKEKVILVIGGSSGIGRASAIQLSKLGAKILLVARREEQLKETLNMMSGDNNGFYVADLVKINEIEDLFKQIIIENGPLSGMVYSAGSGEAYPLKSTKAVRAETMMKINFLAFYEMVRLFSKKGNYEENAGIVGISSTGSIWSEKGQSMYSATKAAMDAFVRTVSKELIEKKIRINNIQPGWVDTDMMKRYLESTVPEEQRLLVKEEFSPVNPQDVANMVSYLLSPLAARMTGTAVAISGGK